MTNPKNRGLTYSTAKMTKKLTINTLPVQIVTNSNFARCAASIYSVDVVLQTQLSEESAEQLEQKVKSHFDSIIEELSKASSDINKLITDNNVELVKGYSAPKDYDVVIKAPRVQQLIQIVLQVDALISCFDALWFSGDMTSTERRKSCHYWQSRLKNLMGRIIGADKHARIALHELNEERKSKASRRKKAAQRSRNRRNVRARKAAEKVATEEKQEQRPDEKKVVKAQVKPEPKQTPRPKLNPNAKRVTPLKAEKVYPDINLDLPKEVFIAADPQTAEVRTEY